MQPIHGADDERLRTRGRTLAILVAVFASSHLDRNIMGILAEPIRLDLGLTDSQLGLMTGLAFAIFYATLGMPLAVWADRGNRRNLIALSVAVWSAMTALGGLAQNYWQLLVTRIGVGAGEAGSNPPSHSIIADLWAPHERATAMGIFATGVSFGVLLGFLIGGCPDCCSLCWYGCGCPSPYAARRSPSAPARCRHRHRSSTPCASCSPTGSWYW